jgi:cation transport ATPase
VGVSGWVEGRHILVGGPFLMRMHDVHFPPADGARRVATAATATVLVASEGAPAAVLELVDPLRKEGGGTLAALRECGVARIVLATGAPSPRRSLQA